MTTPTDKHGKELQPGDHVELVYAGEHHVMQIEAIDPDPISDLCHVSGTVTARVPSGSVRKVEGRYPPTQAVVLPTRKTTTRPSRTTKEAQ